MVIVDHRMGGIILYIFYKVMRNKTEEVDQCFTDRDADETAIKQEEEMKIDINKKINEQMPANQLRTVRRPDSMAPRTFFLDTQYQLLTEALNLPCIEPITPTDAGKLKLKIVNSKNLTLEQYFNKPKFKCIYNKLQTYRSDNKTFLGRLKGIDALIDYNWKNFKEFQQWRKEEVNHDRLDSNFQSGNLCRAYCSYQQEGEFYLMIENDVNTYGYNNWFFFRTRVKNKGVRRFTIVNLIKKTSFFGQGMLISIFSRKRWQQNGQGWLKGGSRITFSSINFLRNHHDNQYYSCLSFEYDFTHDQDEVYFALNQPYTYSRLIKFIYTLKEHKKRQIVRLSSPLQIKNIGYTIANNIIPTLRINKNPKSKEVILIIARQHPCQTTGSFIAEYLIRNLLYEATPITEHLLSEFQFVIIPMVNPDGVIHGMSRCNMSGLDLNRHWGEDTIKELTPEIVKIKQVIVNLSKSKTIKYMIDLHGHGKKLNSFFFACKGSEKQNYRLFSLSMKKMESRFNVSECTYGIAKDKENTIRSKINSMGIAHSYTLQTSLYGWKNQQNQIRHFNQDDYNEIAKSLLKSIFLIEAPPALTIQHLGTTKELLIVEMGSIIDVSEKDDKIFLDNDEILSDSDPQGDRLDVKDLLCKCENKALKKKIQDFQRKKLKKQKFPKNMAKFSTGRLSSKNMRQTCPSNFEIPKATTSLHQSFLSKEPFLRDGRSHAKKSSLNERWQQRRNKIIEKQKIENNRDVIVTQTTNLLKMNARARIKSEVSAFVDRKIDKPTITAASKVNYNKKKVISHKMKTEFRQVQQLSPPSETEIKENDARKSALQLRFKQLKQQSLNVILTDTLSILKIAPQKDNEKHRQQTAFPSRNHKSIKNISSKRKDYLATEPSSKPPSRQQTEADETLRYRKFKQFLANNASPTRKSQKMASSVFYYFPIL